MKIAAGAWLALVSCCAAAADSSTGGFEPSSTASAVEAARQSAEGVVPACALDRPGAVATGQVRIRTGETLCVRLRVADGRPEPVALVGAADAADALVITASLDRGRTYLTLKNPLGQWLRYRAYMRVGADANLRYTSSCPVMSNHRMAFEDWPFVIDEFVLTAFEIEPGSDGADPRQVSCR